MSTSSWQSTMPTEANQVAQLQDRAFAYQNMSQDSDPFKNIIARLTSLREKIKGTEEFFYAQFGLPEGAKGLLELQRRMDLANRDPGFSSMSNIDSSRFDELVAVGMTGADLEAPIVLTFEQSPDDMEILVEPTIDDFLKTLEKLRVQGKRANKSSSKDQGLSKYIKDVCVVEINPATNEKKVKITLKQPLSPAWKKRLEENYKLKLDTGLTREKAIRLWLEREIKNPLLKDCVLYQFDNNIQLYDVNSSAASVKGFLGEVRTSALLDFLCNGRGMATPTGNVKEIINEKKAGEIPIDIIFKGYGFQVKNYHLIEGQANFTPHAARMTMKNFIIERARPEAGIAQLLLEFYGSWQFNQPTENSSANYQYVYSRFANADFTQLFSGYVDNILRVSDEFQADTEQFANMALYYNTFFVISDKFVPSSSILSAIIEDLKGTEEEKLIRSSFVVSGPQGGGPVWTEENQETSIPAATLAAYSKIEYSIIMNVQQILNKAYASVLRN